MNYDAFGETFTGINKSFKNSYMKGLKYSWNSILYSFYRSINLDFRRRVGE